MTSLVPIEQG